MTALTMPSTCKRKRAHGSTFALTAVDHLLDGDETQPINLLILACLHVLETSLNYMSNVRISYGKKQRREQTALKSGATRPHCMIVFLDLAHPGANARANKYIVDQANRQFVWGSPPRSAGVARTHCTSLLPPGFALKALRTPPALASFKFRVPQWLFLTRDGGRSTPSQLAAEKRFREFLIIFFRSLILGLSWKSG